MEKRRVAAGAACALNIEDAFIVAHRRDLDRTRLAIAAGRKRVQPSQSHSPTHHSSWKSWSRANAQIRAYCRLFVITSSLSLSTRREPPLFTSVFPTLQVRTANAGSARRSPENAAKNWSEVGEMSAKVSEIRAYRRVRANRRPGGSGGIVSLEAGPTAPNSESNAPHRTVGRRRRRVSRPGVARAIPVPTTGGAPSRNQLATGSAAFAARQATRRSNYMSE